MTGLRHDKRGQDSGFSRREVLRNLGRRTAAGMLIASSAAACSKPLTAQPTSGDDATLAKILADPQPHIFRRETPYQLTRPLRISGGKQVTIDPNTRFIWQGPESAKEGFVAIFEVVGDNVAIQVLHGGEAIVECPRPCPLVYAVGMRGHRGLTITGIQANECQHVRIDSSASAYERVQTSGTDRNIAIDIRIVGGGARYRSQSRAGDGACRFAYAENCEIVGAHYENVSHGVQWWGGDAGLEQWQNGRADNERKCRNILIHEVSVRNALGGGIWGSMGRDIVVRDCFVDTALDVGFDAEGSSNVLFDRCTARNGHNGCFTMFALCDEIHLNNCHGLVDNKSFPLVRVYNSGLSNVDNKLVNIVGGTFECSDHTGPSSIDSASGPVQNMIIERANLRNVRIDTAFYNMHHTRIVGNDLTFPYAFEKSAIRAGSSKTLQTRTGIVAGSVVIENNVVRYMTDDRTTPATAISVREDDFNGSATIRIQDNTVTGPFATGIAVTNATANVGIVPQFEISRNRFIGMLATGRLLSVLREGPHASAPDVHWQAGQTRDGRAVSLHEALD